MGLLDQPHTSAGRVPTAAGLHYYVRNLLGKCTINPSDKYLIDSILPIIASKDNMLEAAAGALAASSSVRAKGRMVAWGQT